MNDISINRTATDATFTPAKAFEMGRASAADYSGNLDEIDGHMAASEDLTSARENPDMLWWYAALLAEDKAGGSELYHAYAEGWDTWKEEVSA